MEIWEELCKGTTRASERAKDWQPPENLSRSFSVGKWDRMPSVSRSKATARHCRDGERGCELIRELSFRLNSKALKSSVKYCRCWKSVCQARCELVCEVKREPVAVLRQNGLAAKGRKTPQRGTPRHKEWRLYWDRRGAPADGGGRLLSPSCRSASSAGGRWSWRR